MRHRAAALLAGSLGLLRGRHARPDSLRELHALNLRIHMNKKQGFTLIEVMIVLAIIAILLAAIVLAPFKCAAKWERSGMATEWGPIQGCMVEVEPGRWLPDERVREIELPRKK